MNLFNSYKLIEITKLATGFDFVFLFFRFPAINFNNFSIFLSLSGT